jgi:hypothetical protein
MWDVFVMVADQDPTDLTSHVWFLWWCAAYTHVKTVLWLLCPVSGSGKCKILESVMVWSSGASFFSVFVTEKDEKRVNDFGPKIEGRRPVGRPRHKRKDNMEMNFKKIGLHCVRGICVAQNRSRVRPLCPWCKTFGFHEIQWLAGRMVSSGTCTAELAV